MRSWKPCNKRSYFCEQQSLHSVSSDYASRGGSSGPPSARRWVKNIKITNSRQPRPPQHRRGSSSSMSTELTEKKSQRQRNAFHVISRVALSTNHQRCDAGHGKGCLRPLVPRAHLRRRRASIRDRYQVFRKESHPGSVIAGGR